VSPLMLVASRHGVSPPSVAHQCSYKLVALLYDVVPDILIQTGKVKNPCEWLGWTAGWVLAWLTR